jgi:hypothetical protein
VGTSKWDKISKVDLKDYVNQIMYLDTERATGHFMAYDLHGLDPYTGRVTDLNVYKSYRQDEFEEVGRAWVTHVKDSLIPSIAEVFAQMPKRYAHKVSAYRPNIFTNQRDADSGGHRIEVIFYKKAGEEIVEDGPITARQMYINVIKQAMNPRGEQTGMLQYSSLPDATMNRDHMKWLRDRLSEAETMEENKISDAVASFWLKAFRQR